MGRRAPGAVIANHQIRLLRAGAADKNVRLRESPRRVSAQPPPQPREWSMPVRVAGPDLDHFLVYFARQLPIGLGRQRRG